MAMVRDYPTDPRLQPVTIATSKIVFSDTGKEWDDFVRDRAGLMGIPLDRAPADVVDAFVETMTNRAASIGRRTLAEKRPVYQINDYYGERGSILTWLDYSVIPADITLILGLSATLLYKSLKEYKTMRENTILVYNDLTTVVTAIADRVAQAYQSFERMEL